MNEDLARAGWRQGRDGRWYPPDPGSGTIDLRDHVQAGDPDAPPVTFVRTGLLEAPIVVRRVVVAAPVAGATRREHRSSARRRAPEPHAVVPAASAGPAADAPVRRLPHRRTVVVALAAASVGLAALGVGIVTTLDDEPVTVTVEAAPTPS